MPKTINLTISARIAGGTSIDVQHAIPIGATDHLHVTLPANAVDHVVDLQPADKEKLELLLVRCTDPADYGDVRVAYSAEAAPADQVALDRTLLMTGRGGLHGLPDTPTTLYFHNGHDREVPMEILVGRRVGA